MLSLKACGSVLGGMAPMLAIFFSLELHFRKGVHKLGSGKVAIVLIMSKCRHDM